MSGYRVGKGSWWGGRCGLEGSGGLARERMVKWEEGSRSILGWEPTGMDRGGGVASR